MRQCPQSRQRALELARHVGERLIESLRPSGMPGCQSHRSRGVHPALGLPCPIQQDLDRPARWPSWRATPPWDQPMLVHPAYGHLLPAGAAHIEVGPSRDCPDSRYRHRAVDAWWREKRVQRCRGHRCHAI